MILTIPPSQREAFDRGEPVTVWVALPEQPNERIFGWRPEMLAAALAAPRPAQCYPVREHLREELEERGVGEREIAQVFDGDPKSQCAIELLLAVDGENGDGIYITPSVSAAIEKLTGVPAEYWERIDASFHARRLIPPSPLGPVGTRHAANATPAVDMGNGVSVSVGVLASCTVTDAGTVTQREGVWGVEGMVVKC